jgi:hypothetical protein
MFSSSPAFTIARSQLFLLRALASVDSVPSALKKARSLTLTAPPVPLAPKSSLCHPERSEGSGFLLSPCSPAAKLFTFHTSEKHARKPFRKCSFKTKDLKPFRMNIYGKTPGGWGSYC